MKGKDYIAQVELTNRAGEVLAAVGERCDRVPEKSLGWLIEQNLIVPVPATPPARRKRA